MDSPLSGLLGAVDETYRHFERAEAVHASQSKALEMIATGAPLGEVLVSLKQAVESQVPDLLCSFLLMDVKETAANDRQMAPSWSVDIVGHRGKQLGSFSAYLENERTISADETDILVQASRIGGLAIQRHNADKDLRDTGGAVAPGAKDGSHRPPRRRYRP